jgi:Tfp pilus assembly protein PilF
LNKARRYLENKDFDRARTYAKKAYELDPDNKEAVDLLAEIEKESRE